jgi:hypothetical protein
MHKLFGFLAFITVMPITPIVVFLITLYTGV